MRVCGWLASSNVDHVLCILVFYSFWSWLWWSSDKNSYNVNGNVKPCLRRWKLNGPLKSCSWKLKLIQQELSVGTELKMVAEVKSYLEFWYEKYIMDSI